MTAKKHCPRVITRDEQTSLPPDFRAAQADALTRYMAAWGEVPQRQGRRAVANPYYFLKQMSRAGQPGMSVVKAESTSDDVRVMAFARNGTKYPDAIVIVNASEAQQDCKVEITGMNADAWVARRTTEAGVKFQALPDMEDLRHLKLPPRSVVTLFAK